MIIPIYKPKGPSSFFVVKALRQITGEMRIGHAGTLDPLAEGVLIIGIGRESTRRLFEMEKKEKEYVAGIKLGFRSETDDSEGPITKGNSKKISLKEIQKNNQTHPTNPKDSRVFCRKNPTSPSELQRH